MSRLTIMRATGMGSKIKVNDVTNQHKKPAQSEHSFKMNQNDNFVTVSAICCRKSILSLFADNVSLIAPERAGRPPNEYSAREKALDSGCLFVAHCVGPGGPFLGGDLTLLYGCIVFNQKWNCWTNLDSCGGRTGPQNIQKSQYFHFEKRSERYGE